MRGIEQRKPAVIVIGGGFAGLNFIRNLAADTFDVTLVDKNNFNYFTPLLYQVATGFLEPSSISHPLRKLVNAKGFSFRQGELSSIDSENHAIKLSDGDELPYDHLVIATGTKTNFFGNAGTDFPAVIEAFALPENAGSACVVYNRPFFLNSG